MTLARYQFTVVDDAGNVQDGASVTVRAETVGNPLASLFSDRAGVVATGNPVTADSEGYVGFHVAGGAYMITATKGSFTRTWRYVAIGLMAETDGGSDGRALLGLAATDVVEFGALDLPESAPANPLANVARLYAFDDGGVTRIGIKDAAGAVTAIGGGLFLPANSPISWNAGDVTITHSSNALAFAGASSGYSFDNALNISPPAASTTKALNISQTGPTGGSHGAAFDFNTIAIGSEQVSVSGSGTVYGLAVTHGFGGSNALGQRTAIRGLLVMNTATSASQPLGNAYSAVSGEGQMSAGDNGTDTASGAKGTMIGLYGSSIAAAGATNIHRMAGAEINTALRATSSARYHVGLQVTQWGDHAVSGAELDAALQFGNQAGAVGWANYGIVFDVASAGLGTLFKSTATLMGTKGSMSLANGIDISSATFSGRAFKSVGFDVNGLGDIANGISGSIRGRHFFAGVTSGQVILQADDVASGTLTLPSTTGTLGVWTQGSLANDAATSVTPPRTTGLILLSVQGNAGGAFLYATTTPSMTAVAGPGTAGNTTTGVLAGTTSTDDRFTISAHTDGKIYFENRLGFTQTFRYMFL